MQPPESVVNEHSVYAPSSMARAMACPASVPASDGVHTFESEYAKLGTAAHTAIEQVLTGKATLDALLGATIDGFKVDEDMVNAISVFIDYVRKDAPPGGMYVEQRIIDRELTDFGGTVDCFYFANGGQTIKVVDYKHGEGVPVDAVENKQALSYATLVDRMLTQPLREDTEVEIVIIQPRCRVDRPDSIGGVQVWKTNVARLRQHFADVVTMHNRIVQLRTEGFDKDDPNSFNPGDHCQFCPTKATCPALRERFDMVAKVMNTAIAQVSPRTQTGLKVKDKAKMLADSLEVGKLTEVLNVMPLVEAFMKEVYGRSLRLHRAGTPIPGRKLVQGNSHRRWKHDDETIMKRLSSKGVKRSEIRELKLASPAKLEKLPAIRDNPKITREYLLTLWEKPPGGLTLVPEDDPRPAYTEPGPDEVFGKPVPASEAEAVFGNTAVQPVVLPQPAAQLSPALLKMMGVNQ